MSKRSFVIRCACPAPETGSFAQVDGFAEAFLDMVSRMGPPCSKCQQPVQMEETTGRDHLTLLQGGAELPPTGS